MSTYDLLNKRIKRSKLTVNGRRLKGPNRRRFFYNYHIPERRSGVERRSGKDRRKEVRIHTNLKIRVKTIND